MLAFLIAVYDLAVDDALKLLKTRRPKINIRKEFVEQLISFREQLIIKEQIK